MWLVLHAPVGPPIGADIGAHAIVLWSIFGGGQEWVWVVQWRCSEWLACMSG